MPAGRVENDRLIITDAIYSQIPGYRPLALDLIRPIHSRGSVPLVIWIHGGAWLFGTNKHPAPFLAAARVFDRLVEAGYAVARITYRFSAEACFPAQLHDVKAAVRWLRGHSSALGIDPARFAVWGESAGGHLASLIALTGDSPDPELSGAPASPGVSDAVQTGLIWYGPSDLLSMQSQAHPEATNDHDAPDSPESLLVGAPVQQAPERAGAASPVTYVTPAAPPLRLVHGVEDRVVPSGQSVELHERLLAAGAEAELSLVPGADHCFTGVDLAPLVDDALDFLSRTVGVPSALSSPERQAGEV